MTTKTAGIITGTASVITVTLIVALWLATSAHASVSLVAVLTVTLFASFVTEIIIGTRRGNTKSSVRVQHYRNEYE